LPTYGAAGSDRCAKQTLVPISIETTNAAAGVSRRGCGVGRWRCSVVLMRVIFTG
jgi:hypothetical protein